MLMLGLNAALDKMATANCEHWYRHMLSTEDGLVLRRELELGLDSQMKRGGKELGRDG